MSAARKLTYEDTLRIPEEIRVELLDGEVVSRPSPSVAHQLALGGLYLVLGRFLYDDEPGGWTMVPSVDVRFTPHDVPCPDFSGWHAARPPFPIDKRPIDVIPDWICEILSPGFARRDRGYKMDLYAAHGVRHYWILDPDERLLEVYQLDAGSWSRFGVFDESAVARIPPFMTLALGLRDLLGPT